MFSVTNLDALDRNLLNAETLFMSLLRYAIKEVNDLVLSFLMSRIASKLISSKAKTKLKINFGNWF